MSRREIEDDLVTVVQVQGGAQVNGGNHLDDGQPRPPTVLFVSSEFPPATRLQAGELVLVALTPELSAATAVEMVHVLASPILYEHTGGSPPTLPGLTARYERQASGRSGDADEAWLNWIIRDDDRALGYVQATVRRTDGALTATAAWVVRPEAQGRAVATTAARAMLEHLRLHGVTTVAAHISDANTASTSVARRLGMSRTDRAQDGEQVWSLTL